MIDFTGPPCLDKTKPLSIGQVIASQVGMPPANPIGTSLVDSLANQKPKSVVPKSVVPNPYVLSAQAAYQNMKTAQTQPQSSPRDILLSWY